MEWTRAEVLAELERRGVELPEQYAEGVPDSLECGMCPAPITKARSTT